MCQTENALVRILERLLATPDSESDWAAFYKATWPFVFAQCRQSLGFQSRPADTEDVAQNVLFAFSAAVHRKAIRLPVNDGEFLMLLRTIAVNQAADFIKHRRRLRRDERLEVNTPPDTLTGKSPSPLQSLEAKELLNQILSELTPTDRQILMALVEGKSVREIANELGTNKKAIERRRQRFRELALRLRSLQGK